jgi:hypothetical protein
MNNDKLNLFQVVNKLANKEKLSISEQRINDLATKRAKEFGIAPTSQFSFETRDLVKPNWANSETHYISNDKDLTELISRVTFVENVRNSTKFPYIEFQNVKWGTPTNNGLIENEKIHRAIRLAERLSISKLLLLSQPDFQSNMEQMAINALYQKLFSTMFSTAEEISTPNEESPKGLINDDDAITISGVTDLIDLQNNVDKVSDKGIFIISPSAKKELNNLLLTSNIFCNGMLLNSPYICTNLAEDGYLLYIDLSKVCLTQFGLMGVSVDAYTHAKDGYTDVIVEGYFDYSLANDKFIKVGKFIV